uniref:Uncharacterized protein n=1 Tax=Arundo donax TaxID=35708 RepID=A0A0A9GPW5_ARUDO
MAFLSVIGRMEDDASCSAYMHASSSATASMSVAVDPMAGWMDRPSCRRREGGEALLA